MLGPELSLIIINLVSNWNNDNNYDITKLGLLLCIRPYELQTMYIGYTSYYSYNQIADYVYYTSYNSLFSKTTNHVFPAVTKEG